jgi:hypothetical protein
MADSSLPSTYVEPTVMWRMRRGNRLQTHLVIAPHGHGACAMWFLNDRVLGIRDFNDLASAVQWSDRLCFQNWTVGWRLVNEELGIRD